MKNFFIICTLLIATNTFASDKGNGGDAFETGHSKVVWDAIEYGTPFDPTAEVAFQLIETQLTLLEHKLPYTARLIRNQFVENLWHFVDTPLVEVDDEGSTPLSLTYNKIQVAIHKNGRIFIRKDIWLQLSSKSQAFLLLHENLWAVNSDDNTWVAANDIRAQVGIILNPFISKISDGELRKKLHELSQVSYGYRIAPNKALATPLSRYLYLDAGNILFVHRYEMIVTYGNESAPGTASNKHFIQLPKDGQFYTNCEGNIVEETPSHYIYEILGRKNGKTETLLKISGEISNGNVIIYRDLLNKEIANLNLLMAKEGLLCR